jgi:hypothetical protein
MANNVEQLVTNTIQFAQSTAALAFSATDRYAYYASQGAQGFGVSATSAQAGVSAVEPVVPGALGNNNAAQTFSSLQDAFVASMSFQLADFFVKYYPIASDAFDEGIAATVNMMTNNGTGLDPVIVDQMWQRGRDRTIADGLRMESQTLNEFASRGFILPSGAMAYRLQEDRYKALQQIKDLNRDMTIREMEIAVENLRFAVEQALKTRLTALAAASDYLKTLMLGTDAAAKVATVDSDARARLISATADLYRARLQRDALAIQIAQGNQDAFLKASAGSAENFSRAAAASAQAAVGAAQAIGEIGKGALSAVSGIANTSLQSFGE